MGAAANNKREIDFNEIEEKFHHLISLLQNTEKNLNARVDDVIFDINSLTIKLKYYVDFKTLNPVFVCNPYMRKVQFHFIDNSDIRHPKVVHIDLPCTDFETKMKRFSYQFINGDEIKIVYKKLFKKYMYIYNRKTNDLVTFDVNSL